MSEAASPEPINGEGIEMSGPGLAQPAQNQPRQRQADSSWPLFNMYIKMTEEEDNEMAKRWQKDADGILIFTGLFSAALAALATVSVQDLKPNSQDTSAFFLANIYQLLADPNISRASILATPVQPPPFSPSKSAIWVNSLWFLSLVISLTCALLATLLQQWARRYVTITQPPRYSPQYRAPVRAFFAHGAERFHLPWSVEALPALLHLALFSFFIGLAIFLFNINHTVFSAVVWWVVLVGGVYLCITLMPIFWHDSPYYAPLSSSVWFLYAGITYAISKIALFLRNHGFRFINNREWYIYKQRFHGGMTTTVQGTGLILSAETNSRILTWTIDALDEDKGLEQFFETIPGFCSSIQDDDFQLIFDKVDKALAPAVFEFLFRTLTYGLVSEEAKKRRVMIGIKAVDPVHLPRSSIAVLGSIFEFGEDLVLRSVEIGQSLRSSGDLEPGLCTRGIIAGVIASVPNSERDDRWMALAKDQLDASEEVVRYYLAHGDSVLLANLVHITRPLFRSCPKEDDFSVSDDLSNILQHISKFDIQNTLPELQHDFCALWNEMILQNGRSIDISDGILAIRHLYISLHQGADADDDSEPISYPLCNIPSHHIDSATDKTTHPLAIIPAPANPPDVVLSIVAPFTEPVMSSFPASSESHGHVHLSEQSSLHDVPDAPPTVEPFPHTPPVNVTSSNFATTSLDLIKQVPTDTTSNSPHAPAVSTFALDPPFAPPSSRTTDLHDNANLGVVSDSLPSTSPVPVVGDTPATHTQSSLASPSPAFQIDQLISPPEPFTLPSTSAATISLMPPQGTSVSHSSTAPKDGMFDDDHGPPAPDLSHNVEAPRRSVEYETAISGPDIDVSQHALDTACFPRDIGHPE